MTRSRLQIVGHPIHPMLVPFPIAFFTGGLVFDLLYASTGTGTWYTVATWMLVAGVIGAVAAAAAGLVDYFQAIPATGPARNVATFHLLSNTTATLLYAVSAGLHLTGDAISLPWTVVVLDGTGFVALFAGGWLGGELVYRHHIGVEPTAESEQDQRARRAA